MSYINVHSLLPPDLIREIQKYVQGKIVYIPQTHEQRLGWGLKNGTRQELDRRNAAIRLERASGKSVRELADEYALSPDGIRKILQFVKP